jgi:hypothetical protein
MYNTAHHEGLQRNIKFSFKFWWQGIPSQKQIRPSCDPPSEFWLALNASCFKLTYNTIYVELTWNALWICFSKTNSIPHTALPSNHPRIIQATVLTRTRASSIKESIRISRTTKILGTDHISFNNRKNSAHAYTTKYWQKTYLPFYTFHLWDPCTKT